MQPTANFICDTLTEHNQWRESANICNSEGEFAIVYDNFFLAKGTAYAAGGLCELAVDAFR